MFDTKLLRDFLDSLDDHAFPSEGRHPDVRRDDAVSLKRELQTVIESHIAANEEIARLQALPVAERLYAMELKFAEIRDVVNS